MPRCGWRGKDAPSGPARSRFAPPTRSRPRCRAEGVGDGDYVAGCALPQSATTRRRIPIRLIAGPGGRSSTTKPPTGRCPRSKTMPRAVIRRPSGSERAMTLCRTVRRGLRRLRLTPSVVSGGSARHSHLRWAVYGAQDMRLPDPDPPRAAAQGRSYPLSTANPRFGGDTACSSFAPWTSPTRQCSMMVPGTGAEPMLDGAGAQTSSPTLSMPSLPSSAAKSI
jgi:hypothetical protein